MALSEREPLWARFDALSKKVDQLQAERLSRSSEDKSRERYIRELEGANESEVAEYVKSVDDSRVIEAFSALKHRLTRTSLAQLCLDLLRRPGVNARYIGALGIGSCRKGTCDQEATQALVQLIRDPNEAYNISLIAFTSLELIHFPKCSGPPEAITGTHSHGLPEEPNAGQPDLLSTMWDIVNSKGRGVDEGERDADQE